VRELAFAIIPNLWYDTEAEQAAEFDTSIFDNSRILNVAHYPSDAPPPAALQPVTGKRDHRDSHLNHHRDGRCTSNAPASITITPVRVATCSPRASGCRSTCTSSTMRMRACWSTPA
jgi:3-demethylubiquinone-9 3-methyltransferase